MIFHPGFFTTALAAGANVAIGSSIIFHQFFQEENQEQQYNNHRSESGRGPTVRRNLICPFCGLKAASGVYKLNCGHMCHRHCYAYKPAAKRGCTFCEIGTDRKTDDTVVLKDNSPSISEKGVRKRNPTTSEDDNTVLKGDLPSTSETCVRERNPTTPEDDVNIDDTKCAYCKIPIGKSKKEKLPCKHFAHIGCFTEYGKILKCFMCKEEQSDNVNNDDTKCAYCKIPIGKSKKEKLPCKHFAHIGCFTEYGKILKCFMCIEEKSDNVNIDDTKCAYCKIPIGKSKKEELPCKHFAHIGCFTEYGKILKCFMCKEEQSDNINNDDTKCAYCKIPIGESKKEELPCKHFAHIGCFTKYGEILKCSMCMEEQSDNVNIDDTNCAYCEIPIGKSKKEELPCKHFAHIGCFSEYGKILKCSMCMEEQSDNVNIDDTNCAYCEIPIGKSKKEELPCKHFAHIECFTKFGEIMKCPMCMEQNLDN